MKNFPRSPRDLFTLALRILVAVIFLQTLYFKFGGSEESIYIFSTLGVEPWGRYLSGSAELLAVVLLLVPGTVRFGALLSVGIIAPAILAHLTVLGIEVRGDRGLLFFLACIVLASSGAIFFLGKKTGRRDETDQ